jgi:hypothetical protein
MILSAELIEQEYGERCPDFEPGCPCCEMWAHYDAIRRGDYQHLRRSLADLDSVLEEIIDRNPDWVEAMNNLIEQARKKSDQEE